ncbi:hypothetical protein BGZ63DRAFT_379187 [Mariannaea sp. PMI_226]|nr:hypothetical protein BGZ63DRAFT_379187 [Mariannaea sp. PMI_226]
MYGNAPYPDLGCLGSLGSLGLFRTVLALQDMEESCSQHAAALPPYIQNSDKVGDSDNAVLSTDEPATWIIS